MTYEQFMEECKAACRERNACAEGYAALLRSENVVEMLNVAVHNWNDVYKSKYSDIVAANAVRWYKELKSDFNTAGIFVNEEVSKGLVIVSNTDKVLTFSGNAKVYIFGKAHVIARDNCEVNCRCKDSEIELYDNASGKIEKGKVWAYGWSQVESHQECFCYQHSNVLVSEGVIHDYGHRILSMSENITVIRE